MQLKLSAVTATLLVSSALGADDYVLLQYLQYNENNNRTSVSAPSITINKDFGTDYTLNIGAVLDAVSGASPTYYDASSGASAYSRGLNVASNDVKYGNIEYSDTRNAYNALLTKRFENRDELNLGVNYSEENDFYSTEGSLEYMHWLDASKNESVSFGISYQSNEILVGCSFNSDCDASSGASEKKDATVVNAQLSFTQTIDAKSYAKVSLFSVSENGYLTNPYYNVVRFNDGTTASVSVVGEKRPDNRQAYGASLRYANALTSNTTMHLSYRLYNDNWDINSNTLDSDFYYEGVDNWIFNLGLRVYSQSAASFYNASSTYFTNETYASSDERLSQFTALTYKSNVDYSFSEEWSVNFSANYYTQSTGLSARYFMSGFRYNF